MKEGEGPQDRYIPAQHGKTCSGCKHYERIGQLFGHDFRKDNTYCNHPESKLTVGRFDSSNNQGGKQIEFMTQSHAAEVPEWCPFKQPKK